MENMFDRILSAACQDLFHLGTFCHSQRLHRPHSVKTDRQEIEP
ncbi:hypothetical protein IWX87_002971 [Polaromonas sp. CG_9.7]|nr:hypothetical protein [Polaromonas sp. CG_9.7]MBG6115204.1 hypothetical protein [Polaromonas sp. CG_9.2]MDH6185033.1 hypothetical protein [Polaromonas sp. CG_23.6]